MASAEHTFTGDWSLVADAATETTHAQVFVPRRFNTWITEGAPPADVAQSATPSHESVYDCVLAVGEQLWARLEVERQGPVTGSVTTGGDA